MLTCCRPLRSICFQNWKSKQRSLQYLQTREAHRQRSFTVKWESTWKERKELLWFICQKRSNKLRTQHISYLWQTLAKYLSSKYKQKDILTLRNSDLKKDGGRQVVDTQVISSIRTSRLAVVIMMQAAGGRVWTVGQISMKTQPAAAVGRWGGRGGGRGRRSGGGGEWTEGKVAVASFRVRGCLSPTSSHSSVLQPSVRGSEGAAWLLTGGAPLHLWALPLTHLHPETHTDQPGGTRFSSGKSRQIWSL